MSEYIKNLWEIGQKKSQYHSTENVVSYIQKQCKFIEDSLDNIKVRFTQMKPSSSVSSIVSMMENMTDTKSIQYTQEGIEDDLQDINKKIRSKLYGFSIFTDTYKFLVFTTSIPLYYPIYMFVDQDIYNEIKKPLSIRISEDRDGRVIINNPDELDNYLSAVFGSKKMTAVLKTLQEESNNVNFTKK